VCVLAALWGTLQAYPDIYARGVTQYASAIWPNREFRQKAVQRWVCCYVFISAGLLIWSDLNFDFMTLLVAFLATNLAVAIAMVAALYLDLQLPAKYRTRSWIFASGVMSAAILIMVSAISAVAIWEQLMAALS
jgi:hypothetical protein